MKTLYFYLILFASSLASYGQDMPKEVKPDMPQEEISFTTPDSIKIFGDLYVSQKEEDVILLFHQGGSNARGEYRTIIPKLLELGLNILAIDQRVGGQIYGNCNRTVANIPSNSFDNNYGYCDAYNNLEGALDYLIKEGFSGRKIVWGSSYSASLSMKLASERPSEILGVLAFSPASGEVMKGCNPEDFMDKVKSPLLILKPPNEVESERSKMQFELADRYGHQTYAAEHGVHGSSMLVESRVGHDISKNWDVVLDFINGIRSE
ncbi:alpha/beta hydrolase family protein [Zeaxanthinibacter enoshimensis]|uniref:Serine aminopeptidase S33 family n=1 Tax=Zeaxanthinibacter enoshimensis TaxID=392009 RepID=A0A4R6TTE1_9FLAO|nr:hypothetical protein [Zeaxanthinibacter enoshimensis]TDQ32208.1 hypothetical protein CLV82_0031 [Zeaxanthinibacter enoshimensis]